MKCPNCGAEMKSEVYSNNGKGHKPAFCFFCPNGDFGTDYGNPEKVIEEVNSTHRWNEQMKGVKQNG